MQTENQADPTQRTADQLLAEIHKEATEAVEVYSAVREYVSLSIERLETIAQRIERSVKRMEILKQTMKPLPPIVEEDDDRLCAGERKVIQSLFVDGPVDTVKELSGRTTYAEGSLRTWLPMLRQKGFIAGFALTKSGEEMAEKLDAEQELIKQSAGSPEEELCPS